MRLLRTIDWDWILDPPQQTLKREFLEDMPQAIRWGGLFSVLLSYALAETLLSLPQPGSSKVVQPFSLLIANLLLPSLVLFSILMVFREITRLVTKDSTPLKSWVAMAVVALFPLHLLLPVALVCRPLGVGGILLYAVIEIGLLMAVFRRWMTGIEQRYAWPSWAALLVILSPLLLSGFALFMATALLMASAALIVIGLLL